MIRFGLSFPYIILHQIEERSQLLLNYYGHWFQLDAFNSLGGYVESFSVDNVSEIFHCVLKENTLPYNTSITAKA